jgi:hypothetical protein
MHEVELGVWKNLMVHLLRILACVDENLLHELDQRQVKEFRNGLYRWHLSFPIILFQFPSRSYIW